MMCHFTVIPSPKVSDTVVEPYNAALALWQLIENAHMVVCLDNDAAYDVCQETLKISQPNYAQLNHVIVSAMAGLTCPWRFRVSVNSDMRKTAMNLVPFHRLKFLIPST